VFQSSQPGSMNAVIVSKQDIQGGSALGGRDGEG